MVKLVITNVSANRIICSRNVSKSKIMKILTECVEVRTELRKWNFF